MSETRVWLLILGAAAVTYVWRGLGVALGGGLSLDSAMFRWVSAVAYAMLAGLIARMIVLPLGALAETPLSHRLLAAAAALAVFLLSRRNMLLGVAAGAIALVLLTLASAGIPS
jgi:branched-subunit amino acid transport protein